MAAVAFNPSGTLLASTDISGTVQLWTPATGQPVGVPTPADTTPGVAVFGVAFGPSSHLLATGSGGRVRLLNVSPFMNPHETLCADLGAPTWQEWKQYAAGEPRPRVC